MAKLIMREVLDRLGGVLLPKGSVIVVSAEQSGAVQFFLFIDCLGAYSSLIMALLTVRNLYIL
jgi:hypothetical protein